MESILAEEGNIGKKNYLGVRLETMDKAQQPLFCVQIDGIDQWISTIMKTEKENYMTNAVFI